ncbi:glutathione S-transferase family protein [Caballeronia insecticola]|nr:glutathione S-transferase [Caballeronia insecticola]
MRIFDVHGAPNPLRVRIALEEKRLSDQVEFVPVDLAAAEHKQPAFLAMNPEGTVPVLQLDDGTFLSEVSAIVTYLDYLDGKPTLTGRMPKEMGVIHMMHKRAEREILYAIGNYFHYGTPGGGPLLEAHKRPMWKGRTEWGSFERERAIVGMRYFDGVLANSPYVAGSEFSLADITLVAGLRFAEQTQTDISPELSSLRKWHKRMLERPSIARLAK